MAKELKALRYIDEKKHIFTGLSDSIWSFAETGYTEYKSAAAIKEVLRQEGFEIEDKLCGIDTAFCGSFGSGKPVIGILAEYDALAAMSQKSGELEQSPEAEGGNGHGCGHNLLGAGSVAAAVAVKEYLKEGNKEGTVILFGCPAEENGSGKAFLARGGAFDSLDAAITWHPGDTAAVMPTGTLANIECAYCFKGKAAHAAAAPHLGRSALDAVELMNVGANYLREHIVSDARLHYAVSNAGGASPNVVQAYAEVIYLIRAPHISDVQEIYERVNDIARGAALMTGTAVEIKFIKACSDFLQNRTLQQVLAKAAEEVGTPEYSKEERDTAKEYMETLGADAAAIAKQEYQMVVMAAGKEAADQIKPLLGRPINEFMLPYRSSSIVMPASTDVGDVSHICPTAQLGTVTCAAGTPGHSWQMVAQGKLPLAHKGMLQAAKSLALAAIELYEKPEILEEAQKEYKAAGQGYSSPIPEDVKPRII